MNRQLKRITAKLVLFFMVMTFFTFPPSHALALGGTPTIEISVANSSYDVGNTFSAVVKVSDITTNGTQVAIKFNPAVIKVVDTDGNPVADNTSGGLTQGSNDGIPVTTGINVNNTEGLIKYALMWFSPKTFGGTAVNFVSINFKAVGAGDPNIHFATSADEFYNAAAPNGYRVANYPNPDTVCSLAKPTINIVDAEALAAAILAVNNASTVSAMQTALGASALGLSLTAYNALDTYGKSSAAQSVISGKGAGYTTAAGIQTQLNTGVTAAATALTTALQAVNSAATASAMQTALAAAALALDFTNYNALDTYGKSSAAQAVITNKGDGYTTSAGIQTQLNDGVSAAATALANAILAVNNAATVSDIQTALGAAALALDLTGYNALNADGKSSVASAVIANKGTGYTATSGIQSQVNTAVTAAAALAAAIQAVNNAGTVSAMQSALTAADLGLTLAGYNSLDASGKSTVAQAVIDNKGTSGYSSKSGIQSQVDTAVGTISAAAAALAAAIQAVNDAATADAMKTALVSADLNLTLTGYNSLDADGKTSVAQAVINNRGTGYTSTSAIQARVDAGVAAAANLAAAIEAVNDAGTVLAMQTALGAEALALVLTNYNALDTYGKASAAQAVISNKGLGYTTAAGIQTQLNAGVSAAATALATALQAVNSAATVSAMQTALPAAALALDLTGYNGLDTTGKAAVAQALINNKGTGYTTSAQIQTQLSASVTAAAASLTSALQAVNSAATVSAMQTALGAVALALDLANYNGLDTYGKASAAQAVITNKGSGYTSGAQIQTQLDTGVTAAAAALNTALQAVNNAADAAAVQTALGTAALALNLTSFNSLNTYGKTSAAQAVITNKGTGYTTSAQIQTQLDAGVTAAASTISAAVQAVNNGTTVSAVQTALGAAALALDLTAYNGLDTYGKSAAAQAVITNKGTGYTTSAQIQTQLNTGTAAAAAALTAALQAVNNASTASVMQTAIQAAALALDLTGYNGLDAYGKSSAAQAVIDNKGSGYTTSAQIKTQFDAGVSAAAAAHAAAIQAVNNAADTAALQTALAVPALALNLAGYNSLDAAGKTAVAGAVASNKPGSGYTTKAGIQTVVDTAVLTNAISAVNNAADAAALQTILESAALGLPLTVYGSLTVIEKTAVVQTVKNTKPQSGYATKADIQTVFDSAVVIILAGRIVSTPPTQTPTPPAGNQEGNSAPVTIEEQTTIDQVTAAIGAIQTSTTAQSAQQISTKADDVVEKIEQAAATITTESAAVKLVESLAAVIESLGQAAQTTTTSQVTATVAESAVKALDAANILLEKVAIGNGALALAKEVINSVSASKTTGKAVEEKTVAVAQTAVQKAGTTQVDSKNVVVTGTTAKATVDTTAVEIVTKTAQAATEMKNSLQQNGIAQTKEITKVATIQVAKTAGVSQVSVDLPAALFTTAKENKLDKVALDTGVASIAMAPDALTVTGGQRVALSAAIVGNSSLPQAVSQAVGTSSVYDFKAVVGSSTVSNFAKPIEISLPYSLKPGEDPKKITVFYIDDNGRMENMVGKYDQTIGTIVFTTKHFSKFFVKSNDKQFADLTKFSWAEEQIEVLASKGVISGRTDMNFDPAADITRAEFASLLAKMLKLSGDVQALPFADVDKNAWYAEGVAAAYANGIVQGRNLIKFDPNGKITRQEMAAMINKVLVSQGYLPAEQTELSIFNDVGTIPAWARQGVAMAVREGIVKGMNDSYFMPEAYANRAQAAVMLYQLFNK